jgi:hypothetical protein
MASSRAVRIGWFAAAFTAAVAAVWLVAHFRQSDRAPQQRAAAESGAQVSSEELQNIKSAIKLLDRKSSVLEAAVTAPERLAGSEGTEAAEPVEAEDTRSDLEIHRDVLRELDVVLAADQGELGDRRSSAETLRRELAAATRGQARILEAECATAFCKAVIEEDTSAHAEMDTNALIDATPFLKQEAMFDYEREGSTKRTIVYAAREGQSLSLARGLSTEMPGPGEPAPSP